MVEDLAQHRLEVVARAGVDALQPQPRRRVQRLVDEERPQAADQELGVVVVLDAQAQDVVGPEAAAVAEDALGRGWRGRTSPT
jgi:hypothetical protein